LSKKEKKVEGQGARETPVAKEQEQPRPAVQPNEMAATVKGIESALFSVKFYPVAVSEQAKDEAVARLEKTYAEGNETVRQLLLYMVHEILATSTELKIMHTHDYFKMKNPAHDATQLRINVYRSIFNYNTSIEGMVELISMLGRLRGGGDDAVKLLTYHFSRLCSHESEGNHMLRAAILEALGKSSSAYALRALLGYARYTDSERTFNRVASALAEWEPKLDTLKMPSKEKDEIRGRLKEILTSDFGGSHYR
jgi:hypothetical protein